MQHKKNYFGQKKTALPKKYISKSSTHFKSSENSLIKYKNNHSHKKRKSLDTRTAFIEFLKYVENSGGKIF